ncbi:MAG: AAA family ATPase [Nitrospinae bacterium]|nr:AAA family ATPase [Nitrospinota bacterium]
MLRIKRLQVQGYRGILKGTPLLFNSKSLLLFGENGTGKSSFVDALERLFKGRVSSLDGRAQTLSSTRHGPHIRSSEARPVHIEITWDDPASTTYNLSTESGSLQPEHLNYIDASRESIYILRRIQLLEFIESQPRERYAMLKPFLQLQEVEAIENALKQTMLTLSEESQSASENVSLLSEQLRNLLALVTDDPAQKPSEEQVVLALSSTLEQIGQTGITSLEQIEEASGRIDIALAPFGDLTRQSQLSNAVRVLLELIQAISTIRLKQLLTNLRSLRDREVREARVFYESVLEQGVRWINEESRSTCPLCEQSIEADQVLGRIQQRLQEMQEILALRTKTRNTLESVRQAVRSALEAANRASSGIDNLSEADRENASETMEATSQAIQALQEALQKELGELNVETLSQTFAPFRGRGALNEGLWIQILRINHQLSMFPAVEEAQRLLGAKQMLAGTKGFWINLSDAIKVEELRRAKAEMAKKLHNSAQNARKEEVQNIFDELSADIDQIYTTLVPEEGHGGIKLEVREVGQGSANIYGNFHDKVEDPRAYYSEACQDILGLSIFLALRRWHKRQRPKFDLMILDDVLTSIDTAHAIRVSELLLSEFKDYQILITTHDRIWYEHLRDIQARCRVPQNFTNKKIHKWSLESGPDLQEPEDESQALRRLLQAGQSEEIAILAGRLLEHILQEMRYILRLSIQAKRSEQYDIGDMWPAFYSKVKKEYQRMFLHLQRSLDSLDLRWTLRSWMGAHFNKWAKNVPRTNAVEFGRSVLDLFEGLFCGDCRAFVVPSVTPSGQIACSCGRKIYPALGKEAVEPRSRSEIVEGTMGILNDSRLNTDLYFEWNRAEAQREH